MEDCIGIERTVHGRQWSLVHGGYFSDPAIARPLIETVASILTDSPADVVVDLGGGTGFLLSQLAPHVGFAGTAMVNVDCSLDQLAMIEGHAISNVHASVGEFTRGDVASGDERLLYMMRSVLHYVGQAGLLPLLRHLRDQAKAGESFVHQTACFDTERQAACLNTLYRRMHTNKWYPTASELMSRLEEAGWHIAAATPAPPLPLNSEDLARRYALDARDVQGIREGIAAEFGEIANVFELTPSGFRASLHYRIYTCTA